MREKLTQKARCEWDTLASSEETVKLRNEMTGIVQRASETEKPNNRESAKGSKEAEAKTQRGGNEGIVKRERNGKVRREAGGRPRKTSMDSIQK